MSIVWSDKKRPLFGLPLSFTKYELEEERLLIKSGILTIKEDEIRLYRILDVSLSQTLGQRIFGVGTIHCCSSDTTLKEFNIASVKEPRRVMSLLSNTVETQKEEKRVYRREILDHEPDEHDMDHEQI